MLNSRRSFQFDDFRVDAQEQSITKAGIRISVPPRVFQTLAILLNAYPRLVEKAILAEALWPDTIVDESNLSQSVHLLRKALGRREDGSEYIETVPKRGYRFICPVYPVEFAPPAAIPIVASAPPEKSRGSWAIPAAAAVLVVAGVIAMLAMRGPSGRRAPNSEAVRLVKVGLEIWKNRAFTNPAGEAAFRQAIQLDPQYAPAYVGLADVLATRPPPAAEAQRLIADALRMDPNSADAHATAGFIAMIHRWDWQAAERHLRRAIELDSRNTSARHRYSLYLSLRGQHREAAEQIRKALEIEPASAILLTGQCTQLAYEGSLDASIQSCKAALDSQPRFHRAHVRLFQNYEFLQNGELAAAHLVRTISPEAGPHVETIVGRVETAARTGGIRAVFEDRLQNWALDSCGRAEIYAFLGNRERALSELREAVARHEFATAFIGAEPAFRDFHGEPEFQALLAKIGLPR